jgi:exoribonuclease R
MDTDKAGGEQRNRNTGRGRGRGRGRGHAKQDFNQDQGRQEASNVHQNSDGKTGPKKGGASKKVAPTMNNDESKSWTQDSTKTPGSKNPTKKGKSNSKQQQPNKRGNQTGKAKLEAAQNNKYLQDPHSAAGGQGSEKNSNNKKKRNRRRGGNKNGNNNQNNQQQQGTYPPHWSYEECMKKYVEKDPAIIRGKLRVLPSKDGMGFCSCDRGSQKRDVMLESALERNRGMNGDIVFVELLPPEEHEEEEGDDEIHQLENLRIDENISEEKIVAKEETWQDDQIQMELWNPAVPIRRIKGLAQADAEQTSLPQRKGRVVHVCAPPIPSDAPKGTKPSRVMVGTLKTLQSGTCLFTPNDRLLPQFKCDSNVSSNQGKNQHKNKDNDKEANDLYRADYIYHTWRETHKWPPCKNLKWLGDACSVEDQIQGLLMENQVDHGEFSPEVLKNVEDAVQSGVYLMSEAKDGMKSAELGWKPTPEMYKGRRDYRSQRIFTIDPTTAKDLDDALHIKQLPDGRVEIGVHIAGRSRVCVEVHLTNMAPNIAFSGTRRFCFCNSRNGCR